MKEANSVTPVDFIPKLKNASYGGVTGQIAFDARGDLRKPTSTLYQVKNGVWQPVTTIGAN
jgi:branched-chain amino acid transport system substrate-binding protein